MIVTDRSDNELILKEASPDVFSIFWMTFATCAVPALFILKNGFVGLFALVLFGLPLTIMLILDRAAQRRCAFLNRQNNSIEIQQRQLFPEAVLQRPLSDLVGAVVQEHHAKRSDGSPGQTTYRTALQFVSSIRKEEVPLRDVFGDQNRAQELADAINAWLVQDVDSRTPQA